jgi:hypothetical protein
MHPHYGTAYLRSRAWERSTGGCCPSQKGKTCHASRLFASRTSVKLDKIAAKRGERDRIASVGARYDL